MRHLLLALAGIALACGAASAADTYPARPITVVVPYEPGGTADVLFRVIAPAMEKQLGQSIVVVNRGGASGLIGTESVARAEPDGYTLVVATAGLPIAVAYNKNVRFDLAKDLEPIASYANTPYFLFTGTKLPVKTVQDFVALAKKQPGKLSYGSSGAGQSGHLAGAKFALATGTDLLHVPYKGTGPAMTDLASGHIDSIFVGLPIAMPHLETGRIKVLAVASPERVGLRPDVPTIAESGVPGFEARAWYGLLAPRGTPAPVKQKLALAVEAAMKDAEIAKRFSGLGAVPFVQGEAQFAAFFKEDVSSVRDFIRNFPGGLK
ncbi:MAG: tripartite tricarboxylate transporter substrate binding protein [Pigmentiphaga sp.]|uniref:Bug family tripartite tricarboxylate transporter substrate binding protein n=1 Tax=Pigmentiphaga sp. TaxID=1977564 RepID=UPI0029BE4F8C|nr:tripartite tricarboxylate transporter substrate binding protein [Pigmentiphaga sp.]MDX3906282.1 tripartite tricarboxylate transporter substrate binding protein [Pigmentiphaga sp.]